MVRVFVTHYCIIQVLELKKRLLEPGIMPEEERQEILRRETRELTYEIK